MALLCSWPTPQCGVYVTDFILLVSVMFDEHSTYINLHIHLLVRVFLSHGGLSPTNPLTFTKRCTCISTTILSHSEIDNGCENASQTARRWFQEAPRHSHGATKSFRQTSKGFQETPKNGLRDESMEAFMHPMPHNVWTNNDDLCKVCDSNLGRPCSCP